MVGEENMMTEEVEWNTQTMPLPDAPSRTEHQLMTPDQRQLLLQSGNKIFVYNIQYVDEISLQQVIDVEKAKAKVTSLSLLAGAVHCWSATTAVWWPSIFRWPATAAVSIKRSASLAVWVRWTP